MKSHFPENEWYALSWTRNSITLQSVSWHIVDKFGTQAVKKSSELTNPDERIQVYIPVTSPMKPRNGLSWRWTNWMRDRIIPCPDALKRVGESKLMALDSLVRHGRKLQMKVTTIRLGPQLIRHNRLSSGGCTGRSLVHCCWQTMNRIIVYRLCEYNNGSTNVGYKPRYGLISLCLMSLVFKQL